MKPFRRSDQALSAFSFRRPRKTGVVRTLVLVVGVPILLFIAWPYATLWRIDQAVRENDMATLGGLVDLESIRSHIKNKLNKDANSKFGMMSDSFILWLQEGIRLMGNQAVERLVTLPWVRAQLVDHSGGGASEGFLGQITYAFFDVPNGFIVRIGSLSEKPVLLRLSLRGLRWKIVALYF